jgi:hypothetical protein
MSMPSSLNRGLPVTVLYLALSGCALQPYTPPPGSPAATIRVVSASTGTFPPRTSVFTFVKAEACEGRRWLHNETRPNDGQFLGSGFAPIEANKPISIAVISTVQGNTLSATYCAPIFMFTPTPNRHYIAEISADGNQCRIQLKSAATVEGRQSRNEPFVPRRYRQGFDESSSFCTP